jgi:hypothetical protein
MPVDSDPNDGFTGSSQNEDPVVARNIARNMQECMECMPALPLVVVKIRWSGCLKNRQFGK